MENINMTHVFKHPKFYRIPRDKSDQAISNPRATAGDGSVRPGPGLKPQATSCKRQASGGKLSNQPQASSARRQASQPE